MLCRSLLAVCLPLLLLLDSVVGQQDVTPEITVNEGRLRGRRLASFDGTGYIDAFLGVPFAKPPLEHRRFRPPEPIDPWTGVKDAQQLANACYYTIDTAYPGFKGAEMWNPETRQSEDCLQLNIWVPRNNPRFDGSVMIWIYGGGFTNGNPSLRLYNGEVLAVEAGVIVVNINYRVGPFGFLYLGTPDVPGNMGLLDQQLAIKWVHANIARFGGDPDRITLFGESAGAASVSSHLFAPGSQPFYRNVIMQSGSIINQWALGSQSQLLNRSLTLASQLQCDRGGDVADCLRSPTATSQAVIKAADELYNYVRFMEFPFIPVNNDGTFFVSDVRTQLMRGAFKRCPVLIGSLTDEGTYWLPYYLPDQFPFDMSKEADGPANAALIDWQQYRQSFDIAMKYYVTPHASDAIALKYFDPFEGNATRKQLRDAVGRMVGDFCFTCDVVRFAKRVARYNEQLYMFYFTQRASTNPWPKWMGVMHGYEIEYIFGAPLRPENSGVYTKAEQQFSRRMIGLWTTFARTGRPEPAAHLSWHPYAEHNQHYELNAQREQVTYTQNISRGRCPLIASALAEYEWWKKRSHACQGQVTKASAVTGPLSLVGCLTTALVLLLLR